MLKLFLFFSLFFSHYSLAKTLNLNLSEIYETNDYIEYTVAQNLNETPNNLDNRIWKKNKKSFTSFKYANNAYWAKIKVKNIAQKKQTYYFKAENQFTYKIDYYLLKNKKIVSHIEDGVISKNANRAFNATHMIFPIEIDLNSEAEVYFKIRNYNKININFTLVTQEYLLDYYQLYNLIEGMFFGGMLLMLLYNLFLYFLLKITAYLYYVAYVFWLSVYFIGLFGFSQRYFESYTYIFYFSSGIFLIFLTLFVQSILNLKNKLPKINKILNLFILYFLITILLNIYAIEANLFIYVQFLFNLFFVLILIFVSIIIGSTYYLAYYKDDSIAKFYSIVWSIISIIGLLLSFQYLNIVEINIPSNYIFQFLVLIEVLLFSFILAYKINLLEKEKKEQEHLLVQQNKLASMGEVISMIAHQWRQPLSEINGVILNMDIDYQKKQLSSQKFINYLDSMEQTTAYMSQTINDFTDYFKHNKEVEKFTIANLIEGTLNLVQSTKKETIKIKYIKHPAIILTAYRSELIQALLIVINNAIDACLLEEECHNSEIIIAVEDRKKDIIISVTDKAGGISPDIIDKIYDPYFTTKHKSKGTGLGLYILKMIIEESMQGKIKISSSKEITECKLFIPKNMIR
ncbi:MAG: Signal Transduction Histidine Kinase (STHK) with CheB and CheR activity [uncultured Sulfurovum sp.]|uniref:histidine kinase n=1 Tax=uncultured Sulfurovum sp. TaxID=269237 RepID=A0A6S6TZI9_9BACT|nr:MAG: Signal Transduction Histidine Kinase (STHK) with CheB and CheR activity [uncultured Sulfurovum sp.]